MSPPAAPGQPPPRRWRVTTGQPDPATVERLLRLLPG